MGTLVFPANPIRFDGWKAQVGVPPRLGQDNDAVLAELGLGGAERA
jgi:crotonobetainyl-CoA:carnitine CoA-transferase CaiB-like acyl-CoA transferase